MCSLVAGVTVPCQIMGFAATCADRMSEDLHSHMIYIMIAYSSWVGVPWINWEK